MPFKRIGLATIVIVALALPLSSWADLRDELTTNRTVREVPTLRQQLDALIDESERMFARAPVHDELIRLLEAARVQLNLVPDHELAAVDPLLAERVADMLEAIRQLERTRSTERRPPVVTSTGLPSAPYPEVSWTFFIEAYRDANDLPEPPIGPVTATRGGFCDFSGAPTANDQFLQMNLAIVVEMTRDAAGRICGALEDDAGAFAALACIITDILYLVEKGIVENEKLCAQMMGEAEITASYERAEHLHDDLGLLESTVVGELDLAEIALGNALDLNKTLLIDLDGDLQDHDAKLTARADTIDALLAAQQTFLIEYREENLRNHIEARLSESDHKPIAFFLLPEAHGGKLQSVRDVVADILHDAELDGRDVKQAQSLFQQAESAFGRGDYKHAYDLYGRSYRAAL